MLESEVPIVNKVLKCWKSETVASCNVWNCSKLQELNLALQSSWIFYYLTLLLDKQLWFGTLRNLKEEEGNWGGGSQVLGMFKEKSPFSWSITILQDRSLSSRRSLRSYTAMGRSKNLALPSPDMTQPLLVGLCVETGKLWKEAEDVALG